MINELDQRALDQLQAGDTVLDVGAGSGDFTRAALRRGANVIAVDPSRERCERLGDAAGLTVIHAAVGATEGTTRYVDRVRRTLTTNARDADVVSLRRIDSLAGESGITLMRVRARGGLAPALRGAADVLSTARIVRIVGDAIAGDDAHVVASLLGPRTILAATVAGIMPWSSDQPFLPSEIDWLVGVDPIEHLPFTDDDLSLIVLTEGRAVDPSRRARVASLLQGQPQLFEFPYPLPSLADVLDELALDPDPATWRAAAWWRERVSGYDHTNRNARRLAALERQLDLLTGPYEQRPKPFPQLI